MRIQGYYPTTIALRAMLHTPAIQGPACTAIRSGETTKRVASAPSSTASRKQDMQFTGTASRPSTSPPHPCPSTGSCEPTEQRRAARLGTNLDPIIFQLPQLHPSSLSPPFPRYRGHLSSYHRLDLYSISAHICHSFLLRFSFRRSCRRLFRLSLCRRSHCHDHLATSPMPNA
jgi:hypothetical protein